LIELISSAVRDLAESNFLGDRDDQNNPLPFDPFQKKQLNFNYTKSEYEIGITDNNDDYLLDYCEREWSYRNTLSSGSLLGKSCQGALKLAGHSDELQRNGYLFGRHLALAWQAGMDLDSFQNEFTHKTNFNMVCAPILFHLEYDPSLYYEILKGKSNIENIDLAKIHEIVSNGPAIEKTQQLQHKHIKSAMRAINNFPMSEARTALQNITNAMEFY
jgi:decaprenyl-diphosphate synthase subunit 2